MKLLLCFGTRPEAIKIAPISHKLKELKADFKICITAQHREMLDQVLEFFEIVPEYDLDLMEKNQSLNQISALIFKNIDEILSLEKPDLVLVQGDTTTAVIVAFAAFHRGIKVAHVEAGLRTYKKQAPFPEEVNRQVISRIVDFHFAPTAGAKSNLVKEQVDEEQIYLTGNTVVDALEWAHLKMDQLPLSEEILKIKSLLSRDKKVILVTGHRRENIGFGIKSICEALIELVEKHNVQIIFPVHLNPKIKEPVIQLIGEKNNIYLIRPVSYPTMLWLMQQADLIISDSGGIQEEVPSFKKPLLVTREFSERMEGVDAGFSVLVGTDKKRIIEESVRFLNNPPDFLQTVNPFGDGKAAKRITEVLMANI